MTLDEFHMYAAAMIRDLDCIRLWESQQVEVDHETIRMICGLRDRLTFTLRLVNQVAGNTAQLDLWQ